MIGTSLKDEVMNRYPERGGERRRRGWREEGEKEDILGDGGGYLTP